MTIFVEPTVLPYNKNELNKYTQKTVSIFINKSDIIDFCKNLDISPEIFFKAATVLCLTKYTNSTEININNLILNDSNREYTVKEYLQLIKHTKDKHTSENHFTYIYNNSENYNEKEDVILTINQEKDNFSAEIKYNSNLYTEDYIKTFLNSIRLITEQFIKNPKIKDIYLRAEEPVPKFKLPRNPLVNELINEQALKTPNKIAVRVSGEKYTYAEVNRLSNKVANSLLKKGIRKGSRILFMLPRDINLIACFIGIIKAGCVAIPLDTNYPQDRIDYIQENSESEYIITNRDLVNSLKIEDLLDQKDDTFPQVDLTPEDSIFILYTSGSTGKPKGVISTHKGISNLISVHIKTNYKKLLSISSISFDISEEDILVGLTNGIELIFANDEEIKDIILLSELINKTKPEFVNLTPSRLLSYIQVPEFKKAIKNFKGLGAGGEVFTKAAYESIRLYSDADIYNGYGPAETSLTSNSKKVTDPDFITNGKPLLNYITDVRDIDRKLLPFGVVGELYIGGEGVGKGYYNQEEKTRESFIKINGIPYYKSGDYAIQLPDTEVIIKGRIDNQIKLRGQRVELGEIEYLISNFKNIDNAVVVIQKINSEDHLCAYFTSKEEISIKDLKAHIKDKLPAYMVPTVFMQLDEMPETPNGKLDKKRLPKPVFKSDNIKPDSDLEKELYEICSNISSENNFGITDNLFAVGFSSLSLMKLNSDIYHKFGFSIKHEDITNNPTIREIAYLIENKDYSKTEIEKVLPTSDNTYPMSSQERRLYAHYKYNPDLTVYNLPEVVRLNSNVNISKLEEIINQIIDKEEILRTSFHVIDGAYIQKVHESRPIKIEVINTDEEINPDDLIRKYVKAFDLENEPLIRVKIIKNNEETYLFRDIHHIITDQISNEIIHKRVKEAYLTGTCPQSGVQYKDYTQWLKFEQKKEESYWNNKNLLKSPTGLILDYERPVIQTFNGKNISFELDKTKIEKQAKENSTTIYKLLFAEFLILLHKYTQDRKIQVGTITSGRTNPNLESSLGMYVNTLPLIHEFEPGITLRETLNQISKEINVLFANQDYSIDEIISKLNMVVDSSYNPLFKIVFSQNTIKDHEELYEYNSSKFDLTCNIVNSPSSLVIRLNYNPDLYSQKRIENFLNYYVNIINSFEDNLNKNIEDIKILSDLEENEIIENFNDSEDKPNEKTALEIFKDKAAKYPDRTILCDDNNSYSYRELDNITASLANYLKDNYGITNQDKVLYVGKRSTKRIFAFYSILKLNGIYIPLNSSVPQKRLETIISDSKAKVILTDSDLENQNIPVVSLNDKRLYNYRNEDLNQKSDADDQIVIIYTSGTTGVPKAVQISNKNVSNLLLDSEYNTVQKDIRENADVIYDTCNVAFDLSLSNTLLSILFGIKLYVINENFDFTKIPENILNEKNYIINTPTLIKTFFSLPSFDKVIENTEILALAGESLETNIARLLFDKTDCKIYNLYGPAEATCFVTSKECKADDINIGKPLANTKIYILNKQRQLCPVGVPGEICISGNQVSSGYLNNKNETDKHFIKNPYGEGKLYATGDIAYWDENGEIHFMGREDSQIKINGQRIEVEEINTQIQNVEPTIEKVITLANSEKTQLFSYITSSLTIDTQNVLDQLYGVLPPYMIPKTIIQLSELPIQENGKIDIRKLPEPENINETYEPAKTDIEKLMLDIWEKILDVNPIGINDNFYHIGGDSIKAIRIIANLNQMGYNLSPDLLMIYPTVKQSSKHVKKLKIESEVLAEINGECQLTPIQNEFFKRDLPKPEHYNQSLLLKTDEIDSDWLINAFNTITKEHPNLRAVYPNNTQVIQKYKENTHFDFLECDIESTEEINEIGENLQSSINLSEGPLIKLALLHSEDSDYILIVIHHLIIDGISWRIILDNLESLYENMDFQIGEYTTFIRWSQLLGDYKNTISDEEKKYWRNIENSIRPLFEKSEKPQKVINEMITLDEDLTEDIIFNIAKKFNTRINDILIHSLLLALKKTFSRKDFAIFLEGHGREDIGEGNITQTVGWFTTKYPVLFENISDDIKTNLLYTSETLKNVPKKGIGYQLLGHGIENNQDIVFNYLGTLSEESGDVKFKASEIPHGKEIAAENIQKETISINGYNFRGKIHFNVEFNEANCEKSQIKKLIAFWLKYLKESVDYIKTSNETNINCDKLDMAQKSRLQEKYDYNIDKINSLTPLQSYLFKTQSINKGNRIQNTIRTSEILNEDKIRKTLDILISRYPILKTVIDNTFEPVLITLKRHAIEFEYVNIDRLEELDEIQQKDLERGFILDEDSLIRLTAVEHDNSTYLIWSVSHMITDGWSFNVLLNDFFKTYDNPKSKTKTQIPLERYENYLNGKNKAESINYWKEQLKGFNFDEKDIDKTDRVKTQSVKIPEETYKKILDYAKSNEITLNTIIEAAWTLILQKYKNDADVLYGRMVSGRNNIPPEYDVDGQVGMFINIIPQRVNTKASFDELCQIIKGQSIEAQRHDYISLCEIDAQINSLVIFENYHSDESDRFKSINFYEEFDIPIVVSVEIDKVLTILIEYNENMYGEDKIKDILGDFIDYLNL